MLQQKRDSYYEADRPGKVAALVLCPTRELAVQTGTVFQRLTSYLPNRRGKRRTADDAAAIFVDVIHGGVPIEAQVARLARRRKEGRDVDVLVATPGRLVDVLRRHEHEDPLAAALERRILDGLDEKAGGAAREASLTLHDIQEMDLDRLDDDGRGGLGEMLRDLDFLVLDEADRLLGGAFQDDVEELMALLPEKDGTRMRTLLFSATFPEQIEGRVDRVLARMAAGTPRRVSTSAAMRQRLPPAEDGAPTPPGSEGDGSDSGLSNRRKKRIAHTTPIQDVLPDTAPRIEHRVVRLEERHRTQALLRLLDENEDALDRVLVFVATRYATEHVTRKLRRRGVSAAELHGKLDQQARERRLKAFRAGKTRVLVATDLAARGLDVEGLPAVVHYDLPRAAADFVHRTGRTGRAGQRGAAVTFVTARSAAHLDLIERRGLLGNGDGGRTPVAPEVLPGLEPDEERWSVEAAAATTSVPGATHSERGAEHDRMFGGVKGRRKSKKDKLREAAAATKEAAPGQS